MRPLAGARRSLPPPHLLAAAVREHRAPLPPAAADRSGPPPPRRKAERGPPAAPTTGSWEPPFWTRLLHPLQRWRLPGPGWWRLTARPGSAHARQPKGRCGACAFIPQHLPPSPPLPPRACAPPSPNGSTVFFTVVVQTPAFSALFNVSADPAPPAPSRQNAAEGSILGWGRVIPLSTAAIMADDGSPQPGGGRRRAPT